LRDANFGELWVDGHTPDRLEVLFASVQTFNSQIDRLAALGADYYDFIIIDEVHHLTASSYRTVLQRFTPDVLLGLTATPERMDGGDITEDFDGRIAAEIRLPEALNRKLLCPFQYFGVTDQTDLRQVNWRNGKYDAGELTRIFTGHHIAARQRVQSILDALDATAPIPLRCGRSDSASPKNMPATWPKRFNKPDIRLMCSWATPHGTSAKRCGRDCVKAS
jgi:superfamily II DNA or RNA helicase